MRRLLAASVILVVGLLVLRAGRDKIPLAGERLAEKVRPPAGEAGGKKRYPLTGLTGGVFQNNMSQKEFTRERHSGRLRTDQDLATKERPGS